MRFSSFSATASAAIFLALAAAGTAAAQDSGYEFHGAISVELQNDWAYDSDDPDADVNTLYTTIEPYLIFSLTEQLAIETSLVFEPVQTTDPNDNTAFENEGLYAEELKLTYTGESLGVFAGKFNPSFGTAWDVAPGIYGTDFAEDYETTEKIGFGASYTLGTDETGEHTVTANTFFADTSFLSDSEITSRETLDIADGGVSNTEDFSSFSVTLDSENPAAIEGLNTHLGYRNQSEGDADIGLDNEKAYAVGANYTFPVSDDVEAMVLGEWVGIRDSSGTADDVDYLTLSLGLTIQNNWNFAASYTDRDTDVASDTDVDDYVYQISAGYSFDNGVGIDVGYSEREEATINSNTLGGLVTYVYEF